MMRKLFVITIILLFSTISSALAQTAEACPDIVETTLKSLSDMCNPLGRNFACYGSNLVKSVTFTQPPPANFFAAPGDRAQLTQFREINPQPLDAATNSFGAAILNAQADLPNTIPGQAIIFLLLGDARLTNEVAQNSQQQTPFQSFYFLPGDSKASCYESEPILTIQTPGNISVHISLNGVDTEMGPSTMLTITPFVCTIHRGYIIQRVGDKTATLLENQTVDIHIQSNGTVVVDDLRGISQREYNRGTKVEDALNGLMKANGWSQQYITAPPSFDAEPTASPTAEAPQPTAQPTQPGIVPTAPATCAVQYTVAPGDDLRRIATLYGTSIDAIVAMNGITNRNLIYAGQVLCIPASTSTNP